MGQFPRIATIAAVLLCTCTAFAGADGELRTNVEALALQLSDGYATLDRAGFTATTSDQSPYVAVLFTLQRPARGNGSWQYLAFFSRNEALSPESEPATAYRLEAFLRIGGRGTRQFDAATAHISGEVVSVSGMAYGPNDAMCCPSIPVATSFSLHDGTIQEIRVGS